MENLGAMAYSRYTGFREITDRDVLELHCDKKNINNFWLKKAPCLELCYLLIPLFSHWSPVEEYLEYSISPQ